MTANTLKSRVAERYRNFFFAEEPVIAAVSFRVFLALWSIGYFSPRLLHAWELYCRPVFRKTARLWRWLGDPIPPLWLVQASLVTILLLMVALAIAQKRARLWHVLALLPMSFIYLLDTLMPRAYGALAIVQWVLLVAAPYDRLRDDHGHIESAPRFGTRLLQLQFCSVYVFTVCSKLVDGNGWFTGRALEFAFKNPRYGDFLLSTIHLPEWVYMVLAWATLASELFIAFGLWFSKTRRWAMLLVIVMHLTMMFTLRVSPLFHSLMIGHLLLFIPAHTYHRMWPRWFDGKPSAPSATIDP